MTGTRTPGEAHARLINLGLTEQEADAMVTLWDSAELQPLLDRPFVFMRKAGATAVDAYAVIWHGLNIYEVLNPAWYLSAGYTAHQAWILETDPDATGNFFDWDDRKIRAFLGTPGVPRDFIVNALRIAKSPQEAEEFLRRYQQAAAGTPLTDDHGNQDTTDGLRAAVATLSALKPEPPCGCGA